MEAGRVKMFFILMFVLGLDLCARAQYQIRLAWDASVDSNVIGYFVYCGVTSRTYTNRIDVGGTTTTTINGLAANTQFYFSAVAYDASGNVSDFCNEVLYTTPPLLSLGAWPCLNVSALVSTNLINWTPTNFTIILANTPGNMFFRFPTPPTIGWTTNQP